MGRPQMPKGDKTMFDSNVAPVKVPGHWYILKVSSTGKSYKIENDPVGCSISKTGVVKFPEHFIIMDIMTDVHSKKASDKNVSVNYYDDFTQGFTLPDKTSFDTATFWVLGYIDEV